ncbi:MAG: ABC transporter ATP-binding protein [Fibrobacterales bacterium]
MTSRLIESHNIHKTFEDTGETLHVLKGINFHADSNEVVSITGASGCGKSTFLHLLGGLDKPTSGSIDFQGRDISTYSDKEVDRYRQSNVGFVFQFHHLLPEFNTLENVLMPASIKYGSHRKQDKEKAIELLDFMGLGKRLKHIPAELSGGEKQRAAIARALINDPDLILADEPSGNLDQKNSRLLHEMFMKINEEYQKAFIIVTHEKEFARIAHREVNFTTGHVEE